MGQNVWQAPNQNGSVRGRKVQKKSPASAKRLGILPADTLHSLILEDLSVKNIQAGFLTLPTLTRLPTLPLRQTQGFGQWLYCQGTYPEFISGSGLQRRVRPRLSLSKQRSRGSLHLDITA